MGSVGDKIREIRLQRNYTQRKLAQLCGISNTYISYLTFSALAMDFNTRGDGFLRIPFSRR